MAESKVRYDAKADVLYLVCDEGEVARSLEVSQGITVEFGDAGNILGVEILRASKVLTEKIIASLHAGHGWGAVKNSLQPASPSPPR